MIPVVSVRVVRALLSGDKSEKAVRDWCTENKVLYYEHSGQYGELHIAMQKAEAEGYVMIVVAYAQKDKPFP